MAFNVITTVKQAADSYDLTTLDAVKSELDIDDADAEEPNPDAGELAKRARRDAWLAAIITQSSQAIANFCNRVFPVETVADICLVEQDAYPYQIPGGVRALQLSRWPVVSVASVVQAVSVSTTNTLIEGTHFIVDTLKGQLIRLSPFTATPVTWEALTTTVTYTAGYNTVPADLALACLRLVTQRYLEQNLDPRMKRVEQPGAGTREYWVGATPGQNGILPPEIVSLLDGTYRVPVVG